MRRLILSMMVTIDGFIEGPNQELDWPVSLDNEGNVDKEMAKYFLEFFDSLDYFLYGRVAYELMVSYWPTAEGPLAEKMNSFKKIVFSRTLDHVEWNATLIKENAVAEIQKLKAQSGKDLALFAGADIAEVFIKSNMIDEYRLILNPVVLGKGKPLFKNLGDRIKMKLIKTETFRCGNVILIYHPIVSSVP